ncbi:hypothetical protein [Sphingomonas sp. Leaf357]|uniref:hypothetical protein n=1 Tax=Sphingomonas sp. Leaf357 TaxID=1736350 RepID=UPI0012E2EDF2|nr:hypothetical protein [Sphingomonas sp. Leaf357]
MRGDLMDSVGRFTWGAVKFVSICATLLYGVPFVIEQIKSFNPTAILITGLIVGMVIGDYLSKANAQRQARV